MAAKVAPIFEICNMDLHHALAKGHQAYFYQLKVLPAKGDAYNGDIEQDAENDMNNRCADAAAEYPDDVEKEGQATAIAATADYHFIKRR